MIILIDNYDSFTYNLYQFLAELGAEVKVIRNDCMTVEEMLALSPKAIVLSPGPGLPDHAGVCLEIVKSCYQSLPILGVCLGHQVIAAAFGAELIQAVHIKHGKQSPIQHNGEGIFQYLSQPLAVMRYHSFVIKKGTLPPVFTITAKSMDDEEIMAIKHQDYPLYGIQFHPESIGTKTGKRMLQHFLNEMGRVQKNERIFTKINGE